MAGLTDSPRGGFALTLIERQRFFDRFAVEPRVHDRKRRWPFAFSENATKPPHHAIETGVRPHRFVIHTPEFAPRTRKARKDSHQLRALGRNEHWKQRKSVASVTGKRLSARRVDGNGDIELRHMAPKPTGLRHLDVRFENDEFVSAQVFDAARCSSSCKVPGRAK